MPSSVKYDPNSPKTKPPSRFPGESLRLPGEEEGDSPKLLSGSARVRLTLRRIFFRGKEEVSYQLVGAGAVVGFPKRACAN